MEQNDIFDLRSCFDLYVGILKIPDTNMTNEIETEDKMLLKNSKMDTCCVQAQQLLDLVRMTIDLKYWKILPSLNILSKHLFSIYVLEETNFNTKL